MRSSLIASLALSIGLSAASLVQAGTQTTGTPATGATQASSSEAAASPAPVDAVFQEWLTAFNSGDTAAIKAFYGKYRNDPEPVVALDNAEDTCGFDTVRVEARTALTMSVLLAERCFPALQRLTIEFAAPGDARLKTLRLRPLALSDQGAIDAMAAMADRLAARDTFAGSLLVSRGDGSVWSQGWGQLSKTEDAPITADTPLFLASAGKMFTSVAVLQLVQQGKVDLDAPFGRYLTDYPNKEAAKATIRQLLQHTGGTGDIGVLERNEGDNRARIRTINDIIELNAAQPPLFAPGSKMEYSNYGFLLLGAVVERVSGESYYDYVQRHVFEPAGMTTAGFPDLENLQGVATGYTTFFGDEPELVSHRDVLPWRGTPAGGGVASANDMLKFFRALNAGKLLSPELLRLATTGDGKGWYGLGFVVDPGEHSHWGHGGGSYGMDVAAGLYPENDTVFICLAARDMACSRLYTAWHYRTFGPTK